MLTTQNLNTIDSEGIYIQRSNSNAILSRNYPIEKAGFLEVSSSPDKMYVLQRYTSYEGEITYTRSKYNGNWLSWYVFSGQRPNFNSLSENLIMKDDNHLLVLDKQTGLSVGYKSGSTKSTFVISEINEKNNNEFKSFSIFLNSPNSEYVILRFRAKSSVDKTRLTFRMAYGDKEEFILSKDYQDFQVKLNARQGRPNGKIIGEIYKNSSVDFDYIEAYKEYADKDDLSAYRLASSNRNYELVSNTKGAIESLINTALTYNRNMKNLVYGYTNTAYNTNPQAINGKYEIDCSSFTHLMLKGVKYENMQFFKGKNIESSWGYHGIDPREYRWSDEIARFAVDHGYAFYPNEDFTNLRPGDVLFYTWNKTNPTKFLGIQHVGLYLGKMDNNHYQHVAVDTEIMDNVFYVSNKVYMEKCVLAARFPLAPVESIYPGTNLFIDNSSKEVSSGDSITINLRENLEESTFYTLKFTGFKSTGKFPIIMNSLDNSVIIKANGLNTKYDNDILTLYFITPENMTRKVKTLKIKCSGYGEKGDISWEKIKLIKGFAMNDFID